MVMNLEVVRTRSGALDSDTAPFLVQAIEQAEESAGLAESAIALLQMVVGAIGEDGVVSARYVPPSSVAIDGGESDAARAAGRLSALSSRSSLSADVSGGTVILSIPERTPDSN